ncbi:MAG: aminopeptidase N [Bdellovibrionia bacterium]
MKNSLFSLTAVSAVTLSILLGAGCSSSALNRKAYDPRAASQVRPNSLSREMAWLRAHQLGKVTYVLWFGLDSASENYEGRVVANFELKDLKKTIPADVMKDVRDVAQIVALDFEGGQIESIGINGTPINLTEKNSHIKTRYDGHRIYFHTSELLASGANRIAIAFTQKFSADGRGFHRFKDPEDGKVYLYTNSEPYDAHLIFPCFDQPDLKASYELTVEAPPEWQIVSNTLERDVSTVDGRKSWAFPPSPVFSTYLFELAAGPYATWKSDHDGIPLRLFARQSLKKYVDPNEWFNTAGKGLEYYGSYFGYPYPYAKLDQLMVPEFNAGAMENVAAITYTERFARWSKPTMAQKRGLAETILHEIAHQWFGDLVTMRWWNGLWLNESFATFMASKALNESLEFPGAWQTMYRGKSHALWDDQLVTTHSIEVPIPDTESAEANFDGITYGKGAAVLQQLNFYLGDDDFREGLQRYFMKYALRNTTVHDFIKMLSEASGKNLAQWQKQWLLSAGVNGLRADWACNADGEITKFNLIQTPAAEGNPELRPHKTQIALYDSKGNGALRLRNKGTVDVTYSQAETAVTKLIGKACPSFVFPNHEELDYAKVELDPVSLELARKNVARFEAPIMRQTVWHSLRQMVVDGKLRPQDYLDAVLDQGAAERDADILRSLLTDTMTLSLQSGVVHYLPVSMQKDYLSKLEIQAIKGLKAAPAGSDLQKIWFEAFTNVAHSTEATAYAGKLLTGEAKLSGFTLAQPERWQLISALALNNARVNGMDASALIDQELKHDPSDTGIRSAVMARAMIPEESNKKKWLTYFLSPLQGKTPVTEDGIALNPSRLRGSVRSYLSLLNEPLTKGIVDSYFESIPKLKEISDNPYSYWFTESLYPSLCDPSIITRTTSILEKTPGIPAGVVKSLKMDRQQEERCIRARAKAVEAPSTPSKI